MIDPSRGRRPLRRQLPFRPSLSSRNHSSGVEREPLLRVTSCQSAHGQRADTVRLALGAAATSRYLSLLIFSCAAPAESEPVRLGTAHDLHSGLRNVIEPAADMLRQCGSDHQRGRHGRPLSRNGPRVESRHFCGFHGCRIPQSVAGG